MVSENVIASKIELLPTFAIGQEVFFFDNNEVKKGIVEGYNLDIYKEDVKLCLHVLTQSKRKTLSTNIVFDSVQSLLDNVLKK